METWRAAGKAVLWSSTIMQWRQSAPRSLFAAALCVTC